MGDFKASEGWLQRWKKRNQVAIRRGTTEAQKIPEDHAENIKNFSESVIELRNVNQYSNYNIMNMDQTMCRFDMAASSTNNVRGEKTIRIATTGGNKRGFTVALSFG